MGKYWPDISSRQTLLLGVLLVESLHLLHLCYLPQCSQLSVVFSQPRSEHSTDTKAIPLLPEVRLFWWAISVLKLPTSLASFPQSCDAVGVSSYLNFLPSLCPFTNIKAVSCLEVLPSYFWSLSLLSFIADSTNKFLTHLILSWHLLS